MVSSQQMIVCRRGTDAGWDTGVSAKYLVCVYAYHDQWTTRERRLGQISRTTEPTRASRTRIWGPLGPQHRRTSPSSSSQLFLVDQSPLRL